MEMKATARRASSRPATVDELLASASTQISTNTGKSSLKTLIWSLTPSSPLLPSLPHALHLAISRSLSSLNPSSPAPKHSQLGDPDETRNLLKELRSCAYIAHLCVSHPKKPFSPTDLFPSIRLLHDSLVFFDKDPMLLSTVADLCEDWWKERLPGRECLISQSLPFLVSRSLMQNKKADVRRVYALREAFVLFDYEDESIEDTRLLLVRCVITPAYLKTEEGRKFVAFVFGLNGRLMKEALALIHSQIPFGRKSVLEGFADIIFRAWKGLEGGLREEMEVGFLQGLIEGAIYASSRSLAASVRRVLSRFIEQRTVDGVEKLLFRLAEPVLFRSLQVANSNVRQNALYLLLDLFPLDDPDVTKEIKDTLLEKQFYFVERLLLDDCPDVRAVAVEGSCRILHQFWEVIPSSMITNLLTKVTDNISYDTCTDVRLSSVNAIVYLLDNPQSHEILRILLPRLGGMFSDRALSVRVAVADLLLAVRDVRTFQFHKVVGLDALLSALANDHPVVAQKITSLLLPSYFSSKVTMKEACSRCITLIKRSPNAGARFCEFALSEGSSPKSLIELLKVSSSLAVANKDLTPNQIDGFFVASGNICHTLSNESACKPALLNLFSGERLKCFLTAAGSHRAQAAVLRIASIVSPEDLTRLHDQIMALVTDCPGLSENLEMQSVVQEAHKLIFSCGWFDELLNCLINKLQNVASGYATKFGLEMVQQSVGAVKVKTRSSTRLHGSSIKSSKGSPSSSSHVSEDFSVASAVAWQIKNLLSNNVDTRNAILRSPSIQIALSALEVISQVSIEQYIHWECLDTSPLMAFTVLAMYRSTNKVEVTATGMFGGDHNSFSQCTGPSPDQTTLDQSLSRLLSLFERLFSGTFVGESGHASSSLEREALPPRRSKRKKAEGSSTPVEGIEHGTCFLGLSGVQNVVKLVTSVLKFIADATTVGLIVNWRIKCLKFASAYVQYVICFFRNQSMMPSCKEEDLNNMLAHLKSSLTYMAKFLHLVLSSTSEASAPPQEVFDLSNNLLDLFASLESYLGSRYASAMFSVIREWMPVVILGLGSRSLTFWMKERKLRVDDFCGLTCPEWLVILSKAQLFEVYEVNQGKQDHPSERQLPAFVKLMEVLVLLLKKGKPKLLEAVGNVFLTALEHGLEKTDFDLVLGLAYFTCVKLLNSKTIPWEELEVLKNSLQEISSGVERCIEDPHVNGEEKQKLVTARTLIRSVFVQPELG